MDLYLLRIMCLLVGTCCLCSAQKDTEFWFAAPNVIEEHGDRPVYLRLTAGDEDANVIITQPANLSWSPVSVYVAANSSRSVDLTSRLASIENTPPFSVLRKGLYIQSDRPVTAYYEVDNRFNPDIFALKGRNALGESFFIPAQNYWGNAGVFNPAAKSAFDIVASADDTNITIRLSVSVSGHLANQPFTITLDRGETYSVEALDIGQEYQLTGSQVTSDKPIAITIKHDSNQFGNCYDLSGDQLVPVHVLGTEYIVVQGFLEGPDQVFIVATQDGTSITIDSPTRPATITLSAGAYYRYPLQGGVCHVSSNHPVYVMHLTGFGCEVGMALVPKLECTGSQVVNITRSTDEFFGLVLITQNGNQDGFEISPRGSIAGNIFSEVPGTDGKYVSAKVDLTQPAVGNQAFRITNNDGPFHLGIINGGGRSGTRYGYFSDFKRLKILSGSSKICLGSDLALNVQGADKLLWLDDEELRDSRESNVIVSPDSNTVYRVVGMDNTGGCIDTAEINVEVFEWAEPQIDISPTCQSVEVSFDYMGTEVVENLYWIIENDTLITDQDVPFVWQWPETGQVSLTLLAENPAGCITDTTISLAIGGVAITYDSLYYFEDGQEVTSNAIVVDGSLDGAKINWSPSHGLSCNDCLQPVFSPEESTIYSMQIEDSLGCVNVYDFEVIVHPGIFFPTAFTPNNDQLNDVYTYFTVNEKVIIDQFLIANRWGQIVFEYKRANESTGPVWDGTLHGQPADAGTYVFDLKGTYLESQIPFTKKGSFHLIR